MTSARVGLLPCIPDVWARVPSSNVIYTVRVYRAES